VGAFVIEDSDRVADKTNVAATFSFTTTAGGALVIGSNITLTYPPGFFSSSATPSVLMSGSASGTSAPPSLTAIVVTTATVGIAASANVIVTLTGLKLGPVTAGNSTGITLSTSSDLTPSVGLGSGAIGYQVMNALFFIAPSDRVAGKSGSSATFSFTPTVGGALTAGGNITLTYPSGFFASGVVASEVAVEWGDLRLLLLRRPQRQRLLSLYRVARLLPALL